MNSKITFEKIIVNISRLLVGFLFIFSGLIKLNDPLGFSFKLEEYFGSTVFNIEFLLPYTLLIAIFIVILEVLLGVFLLIGFKKKFTLYSLLTIIIFFTFLTWYSAYFDVVKDCGCFGDAIKLTPWESFTKDVILLILILFLLKGIKHIKPFFKITYQYLISFVSLFLCFLLTYQVLNHLPVIDFRPYKIGTNIIESRKGCAELNLPCPEEVLLYSLKDKSTGEKIEIYSDEYLKNHNKYDFIKAIGEPVVKTEGYVSPIQNFSMDLENKDYTEELMQEEKLLLFVFHDISKMKLSKDKKIDSHELVALKETIKIAKKNKYKIVGLTSSGEEDINHFESESKIKIDFYFCDVKTAKTIVRSNLGALKIHNGIVIQKTHSNDLDKLIFN